MAQHGAPAYATKAHAVLVFAFGAGLAVGGVKLLLLGGSWYYALAGAALVASAVLLWRRRSEGAWLYAAALFATVAWAIGEAGFDGWALTARLAAPAALGLWLLTHWSRRALQGRWRVPRPSVTAAGGAVAAILIGAGAHAGFAAKPADPIYQAGLTPAPPRPDPPSATEGNDWLHYGRTAGGTRFSALTEINPQNVSQLKPAWVFRTGKPGMQATPLQVGETLYFCTSNDEVIALDATTGKQRWRYSGGGPKRGCRGVAYYESANAKTCRARIIKASQRLVALDAATGQRCADFGDNGEVSLLTGMGEDAQRFYYVSSPPAVVRGKVVVGGSVTDNQYRGEPSGVIRAFDAITGKLSWAFDVGRLDRQGEPPANETYTRSTPNSWAPMSADEELGLVYAPMGNPVPDYFGGARRPFDERYSSAVVAIDADTGKPRWSFQTTRHDLWDYDIASQPTLADIPTPQGLRRGLIQATKRGDIFLLDRATGELLSPVVERPTPQSGGPPEEILARTQPFSDAMPSVRGPDLEERSMWGITPLDQLWCRIKFKQARYEGIFTPPGLSPSIVYPGYLGGANWGGVAVDSDRHLVIVNSTRFANYLRLITRAEADRRKILPIGAPGSSVRAPGGPSAQANTPYGVDVTVFMSPLKAPCQAPPYGALAAIDLTTRKLVWTRTFGTARDSGPWGLSLGLPIPMGVPNVGGAVVTRSGLVFIGATQDRYVRAISADTGETLWRSRLPAGGQATPMTYSAGGRQYVVIAAAGHAPLLTKPGDYLIAYALPEKP